MKITLLLTLLVYLSASLCFSQSTGTDRDQIEEVLQYFYDDRTLDDTTLTQKVFHKSFRSQGMSRGAYYEMTLNELIDVRIAGTIPKQTTYQLIDISGYAAIAKIEIVSAGETFTEYIQLLKTDGQWSVVNQTCISQ